MSATESLRDRLGVSSPAEAVPYLNLLIYGAPGAGKTYLAGTAQDHDETSPVLFLDIEGGTTTLRKRKDIDVVRVSSVAHLNNAYELLASDTSNYYKTTIIDSLSELAGLIMEGVLMIRHERRPDLDNEPPGIKEWGIANEKMRKLVRAFRDLPCNTIMTALEKHEKDESEGITYILPNLSGKLAHEVPGFMDIVGYLSTKIEKDVTVRTLQTTKTRRVIAKDRTSALDPVTESPSIPLLFERIMEQED